MIICNYSLIGDCVSVVKILVISVDSMMEKAGSRINEAALSLKLQTGFPKMGNRIFWVVECFDSHVVRGLYKNLERDPDFSNPSFWEDKVAYIKEPNSNEGAA